MVFEVREGRVWGCGLALAGRRGGLEEKEESAVGGMRALATGPAPSIRCVYSRRMF